MRTFGQLVVIVLIAVACLPLLIKAGRALAKQFGMVIDDETSERNDEQSG